MKKAIFFPVAILLSLIFIIPAIAGDATTEEIEQLKAEVRRLQQRIEELEKKQSMTEEKAVETEKKVGEMGKNVAKVEKKSLSDRLDFSGEARFRMMRETAKTNKGFYGKNQPGKASKWRDETSFPLRVRLNAHAEVVPGYTDFYARLTINKRWGAFDDKPTDPFNNRNSFEASIGHDITPRFERAYMTQKLPFINSTWYIGRLPALDGPPQRQAGSLFPRLFIDSEIDGTLLKWEAPENKLDHINLPWAKTRLWGKMGDVEKTSTLKQYKEKLADKTGVIIGYLKYDEKKMVTTEEKHVKSDADVFLTELQFKLGKDTALILDGLVMQDWHMPNTDKVSYVPDLNTDYYLTGGYGDTQLFGFQIYGACYYSHFKIPEHSFKPGGDGPIKTVPEKNCPGHIWLAGFNTGDLITPNQQLTFEYSKGSDAWINPFNYRGYRRKGTVLQPAGNSFYDPSGKSVVGFYPFNARVVDIYYDYYFKSKVRFRLGYMDFRYDKHHKEKGEDFSILGSSKYQHDWWPYLEVNLSF